MERTTYRPGEIKEHTQGQSFPKEYEVILSLCHSQLLQETRAVVYRASSQ